MARKIADCVHTPPCPAPRDLDYIRSVCRAYSGHTVKYIVDSVEEPEKVPAFVRACREFGIRFKSEGNENSNDRRPCARVPRRQLTDEA